MVRKGRLDRIERILYPNPGRRIVLLDGCDPPHWMISGHPEAMQQGEPDLRESDYVVHMGDICLEAI